MITLVVNKVGAVDEVEKSSENGYHVARDL